MITAYEHGRNAATHAKHIQACPFDAGTTEWREWRAGFHGLSQTSSARASIISIIDDDRSVRDAVKNLVRLLGYEAVTFASAEEYLGADRVRDSGCIITDVHMPGMTGIDLRDRLVADDYRGPIIFMSALSAEDAGANELRTAASVLKKPFSDE